MSSIDQKEYLKRYLSLGGEKKKKKRKKKENVVAGKVKIIDDNLDVSLVGGTVNDLEIYENPEDAPQIVGGVVDDRPIDIRLGDFLNTNKWKPFGESDDQDSAVRSDSNELNDQRVKTKFEIASKESAKLLFEQKPSKGERSRLKSTKERHAQHSTEVKKANEDSSPSRSQTSSKYYSDGSPRGSRHDSDNSPVRKRPVNGNDSDNSPPRIKAPLKYDSDNSPPRKQSVKANDSDNSPPRRNTSSRYDSDNSPPRRNTSSRYDSDNSPPRRKPNSVKHKSKSPPRRHRNDSFGSQTSKLVDRRRDGKDYRNRSDRKRSPHFDKEVRSTTPPKKMSKTLDGKTAGLQNAQSLRYETTSFKKREDEMFENMSAEVSGKGAAPVMRDRKTGKIRDIEKENAEKRERERRENENKEKYDRWGKGLKQVEDYREKIEQDLHEMSKPFARYADDEDLERYLKAQEREGDPMLKYIRSKKKKEVVASGKPLKPQYEGDFMPNRFGIAPGYRWDGVDRSNGYEKRWFEVQNSKKAVEEIVYKWSIEDM